MPLRAAKGLAQTVSDIGWPMLFLAGIGLARLGRAGWDRLTLALAAWSATYLIFFVGGAVAPVAQGYERYAIEFVSRLNYATYPAVVILAARGKTKDADSTFDRYARSGKSVVAAAAELDSYRALAERGKVNEAIAAVKRAIESSSPAVPKDALLAELGDLYERSGSPADAKAIYQRLVSEYPESSYASQVQGKIAGL